MQIDPSVSGRGLVTTCGTTADHKFPRCQKFHGGRSRLAQTVCSPRALLWRSTMSRSCQNRRRAAARTATNQDASCAVHAAAMPTEGPVPSTTDPKTSRSSAAPGDTPAATPVAIGVGIDTSRYGHHAIFLDADLQPAAPELKFVESAQGYQQLQSRLAALRHSLEKIPYLPHEHIARLREQA